MNLKGAGRPVRFIRIAFSFRLFQWINRKHLNVLVRLQWPDYRNALPKNPAHFTPKLQGASVVQAKTTVLISGLNPCEQLNLHFPPTRVIFILILGCRFTRYFFLR